MRSGSRASTTSKFQLSGRFARTDIAGKRSSSCSSKPSLAPSNMPSRVVPGHRPVSSHRARISSWSAPFAGTGSPFPSLCELEQSIDSPSAPASRDSPRARRMSFNSVSVAARKFASAPRTYRRSALCPTMNPAFTAMPPSSASRNSPNVDHDHGTPCSRAESGMPSTFASMRLM